MTVSNTQRRYTYLADGVTRDWPIEFSYHNSTDIKIYHIDADGVETEITDITVVAGAVTAPATGEPFASGESIRVERALPYTQLDDYTTQGAFTPEDMERTADRLIMITQQIRDVAGDTKDYVDENLPMFEEWKDITLEASGLAVAAKERAVLAENAAEHAQGQAEGARDTILDNIDGAAAAQAAAELAQTKAEQARDASVTAKGQSESARDAAVIAKTQSVGAKDISVSAKDDAVIAKTAAQTAQELAETAKTDAINAKDAALAAKGDTEGIESAIQILHDQALAANSSAQTAKTDTLEARDTVLAAAQVFAWNEMTEYNFPDLVARPDGHTYRCLGNNVIGQPYPEVSTSQWIKITTIVTISNDTMWVDGLGFADASPDDPYADGGTF